MADYLLRCGQCGLPWGKICNGVLVVESRHHGERHVNAIALVDLAELQTRLERAAESSDGQATEGG